VHPNPVDFTLEEAMIRLTMSHSVGRRAGDSIYVGTSGWAYASWKPDFYPPKTPAKKMLAYYGTQLNSVEVNYTFRQLPTESMLAAWLADVPENFRFSFKAPQRMTHYRRLKECGEQLAALDGALRPVLARDQFGLLLLQLPPNFKIDLGRVEAFLADARGSELRMAFEFRDASWFTDQTYALLIAHQAALCVAESDELITPRVRTAPFTCYRLRKSSYSEAEIEERVRWLTEDAQQGQAFAYFKHEEAPDGALRARELSARLRT
jgi:uncharacterized protein YecE (DUF72 family)